MAGARVNRAFMRSFYKSWGQACNREPISPPVRPKDVVQVDQGRAISVTFCSRQIWNAGRVHDLDAAGQSLPLAHVPDEFASGFFGDRIIQAYPRSSP